MTDFNALLDQVTGGAAPAAPETPAAQPSAYDMDGLLDAVAGNPTAKLDAALYEGRGINPEEEAKRRKLALELGLPPALAPEGRDALAELQKRYNATDINAQAPKVGAWLAKDVSNVAVSGTDIEKHIALEKAASYASYEHKAFTPAFGGSKPFEQSVVPGKPGDKDYYKNLLATAAEDEARQEPGYALNRAGAAIGSAVPKINEYFYSALRVLSDVGKKLSFGPDNGGGVDWAGKAKAYAAEGTAMVSRPGDSLTEAGVYGGLQSTMLMAATLPAAGAGALAGMTREAAARIPLLMLSLGTGAEATNKALDQGNGLGLSLLHGAEQGTVEYVTELLPAAGFLNKLDKTFTKAALNYVWRDVLGEQIATAWQDFNDWVNLNPTQTLDNYLEARPGAAYQTLIATLVMGGAALTTAKTADLVTGRKEQAQAQKAETTFAAIQGFTQAATANPLRERSPEAFKSLLGDLAGDDSISEVFVNAKTLDETLGQAGVTLEEVKAKMPEVAAQFEEALATNGDVRISLADYGTHIAGTGIEQQLMPHMKAEADGMTFAQSQEYKAQEVPRQQKQAEKILADAQKDDVLRADIDSVREDLAKGLLATGRFTKSVVDAQVIPIADFFTVQASREGKGRKPSELYAENKLLFQATNILGGPSLNQQRTGLMPIRGVHFSGEQRATLAGGKFGTGIPAAESQRLSEPGIDPRLQQRVSFYVDEGQGVVPEAGLGSFRHEVDLTNIYDGKRNPLRFPQEPNAFEKAVLDAGFDGYYIQKGAAGKQGVAVLLGKAAESVQVLPTRPTVNVGLDIGDKVDALPAQDALAAIKALGVDVVEHAVHRSKTENTVVAELSRELTRQELDQLAAATQQEAIPQYVAGRGDMGGPQAAKWGPFNPEYFKTLDGRYLSEVQNEQAAATKEQADARELQGRNWLRGGAGVLDDASGPGVGVNEPLRGLPTPVEVDGKQLAFGPFQAARDVAKAYVESTGRAYAPPRVYTPVDAERAARIAQAFEDMQHDPAAAKGAYDALIQETVAQWEAIKATGLKVEFITGEDPYGNPRNAILDIVENNHFWVYPTDAGFGGTESLDVDISGNPLLQVVEGETISGKPVRANDIFRIVHDYFGHAKEGIGFRAVGEDNAWRQHMAMFSPLAQRALTVETRGQNSWVNFGPYAEFNRTANGADTQYAPQKVGLLPEWVSQEGLEDPTLGQRTLKPEVIEIASKVLRHLTPEERTKLRKDTARKLVDIFDSLPDTKEMAAVAYAGRAKKGWYHHSSQALVHVFGADAPRFAGLLAAMSPQTSVEINLRNALVTWKNWIAEGRPTDRDAIVKIMGRSVEGKRGVDSVLDAWINNSVRALSAEDPSAVTLSGPKVNSFMLNLRGHVEEVTNDAWMSNYALVNQTIFKGRLNVAGDEPGKGPGYLAMSAKVRAAAKQLTKLTGEEWTPAEVQETVWSWAKAVYEAQTADLGAREVVSSAMITDELISSTPDFRNQLHEASNESTLEAAGYGEQLSTLHSRADITGTRVKGGAADGQTAPFDPATQQRLENRAAARLEQLRALRDQAAAEPGTYGQSAFYSALEREIPALVRIAGKDGQVKVDQAKAWIAARQKEGKFKQAEVEAIGLYEWLELAGRERVTVRDSRGEIVFENRTDVRRLTEDQPDWTITVTQPEGKIPVADIVEFVAQNGVQVEDVMLSGEAVDEDFDVDLGQFEIEEPDESYMEEVARESYLDGAKQDIADQQEIALDDVDEDDAMQMAVERATESYWSDGDAPASAEAEVSFGGRDYRYSVTYSYGETEIYRTHPEGGEVYQGRALMDYGIREYIREDVRALAPQTAGDGGPAFHRDWMEDAGENFGNMLLKRPGETLYHGVGAHFDGEANLYASVIHSEKIDAKGRDVLLVHEGQSDWGQEGRDKGFGDKTGEMRWAYVDGAAQVGEYRTREEAEQAAIARTGVQRDTVQTRAAVKIGVPPAPFVTDTKAWTGLWVKRMLRAAAEHNRDLAWSVGDRVADRYSLRKRGITGLMYDKGVFTALRDGVVAMKRAATPEELPDIVGKAMAERLLAKEPHENGSRLLSGLDLDIGGEGMIGYYDRIIPQVVNDIMKKLGVEQRAEMTNINASPYHVIRMTPELKEKIMSGLPLFARNAEFDPATLTATFLKGANLSSVQHEAAHFYLEVLTRMAAKADASEIIKSDVDKIMNWFGIAGDTPEARLAKWQSMTLSEQREHHETWAESHERWLLEGKAPAVEMQPLFARFRSWMLSVYKSLEQFLQANPRAGRLNDEVRGVFSRMLASEEAIAYAEQVRGYGPLFKNEQEAGTSPETFAAYVKLGEDATLDANTELQNRSLRDIRWLSNAKDKAIKKLQAKANGLRKEIKAEVTKAVMAEPINQARNFLTKGETTDPNTGEQVKALKGYKLDTAALKEMYPETGLANPDLTKLRGMQGPGGLHPDMVAQMFGFSSGDALVRELIDGENRFDKIDGLTDTRMLEENGELIDERSIELAAESAIHNQARAKFLATGLKMLTKSAVPVRELTKAAKMAAENAIAGKRVRDLRPLQYTAAEARSNKEALKLAVNDPQGAVQAQRAALLNNQLARAAGDAVEEVQALVRYLKKFENLGTRKSIDIEYVEQIDSLLAPFDLSTGVSFKELDRRTSLIAWVEQQEMLGFQPAIDAETIEMAKQKSYKDMTVEELRGFADAIKQVEHLGRLKKKLLTAKDAREFATRIEEATASIIANANRKAVERATPTDVAGQAALWVRQLAASHRKFSSFMREMDGSHDGGVMWELLSRPMNEAGDKETRMRAEATAAYAEIFKPIQKVISAKNAIGNLYDRSAVVPGTNISMTHEQRVMFAMNWGNEGNRQRLLDGGLSGKRAMSTGEAQAILDTLTHDEWNFVQATLDYVGSYRDQIAEQERQLTGVEPKWVEAAPIETKFGTFPGGYFPAKYDVLLSTRSDALEAVTDLRQSMKGAFGASSARNGYTKARAEAVTGRPMLLSFDVIARHTNEVIHRLSWQSWLTDANRTLRALDGPIRDYYGVEVLKELQDTVVGIAAGDTPATSPLERGINHLRIGSTIAGLGWRVMTALQQPSGLAQSWSRIGGGWLARGVTDFLRGPLEAGAFVNEKSSLMRDRATTMQREINEVMNTVRAGEANNAVRGSFFTLIGKMQRVVDIPTWLGAYEKANAQLGLENAGSEEERTAIDEKAVAMADQAVIDSQSGGQVKDLAKIQRGSPALKMFTNFYSYFSATYNLNVEAYRRTDFKSPSEVGLFAVDALLLNTVPVLFAYALKELLKGDCGDDVECMVKNFGREQANFLFGQMIPLREVGAAATVLAGGQGYGYSGPAGLRFFSDLYKLSQQAAQGEMDKALFKAANSVGGTLLHYPAGQVNATVDGIMAVENGEVEGAMILPALLVGPPRK